MPLRLLHVDEETRPVWDRLFQLYLHDMSENTGQEPGLDGAFPTRPYDDNESSSRLIVLLRNKPAGLVSLRSCAGTADLLKRQLDDFFILRCYRRLGIGEEVARMVFDSHPGNWQAGVNLSNESGRLFLRQVVRRYTYRQCRELNTSDGEGVVFEFTSPPPDAIV